MEFVGPARSSGASSLFLGVPGLNPSELDPDDDEGDVVIGIRPKSSPLPRRRSSASDGESEPQPPPCGSRRVSFADAKGLSLVQVKEFDSWGTPKLPGCGSPESKGEDAEECFLSPATFSHPLSTEELFRKVQGQRVELEAIAFIPGTTVLKGVIRVLNISFHKAVYVRTTLDSWSSHFDLLAEYVPGSGDSLTDCFVFRLTLVPPFGEEGARVEFCLRYETPVGTFWANNTDRNYVLFCHQRVGKKEEKPKRENVNKKSCLKAVSQNLAVENNSAMEDSSQGITATDVLEHKERVDTERTQQITDGPSGTPAEDGQTLLAESRRNRSGRESRKAARMARVRDFFAQRDGGAGDVERGESPPRAEHAAREETAEEKLSGGQASSEGSGGTDGSPRESPGACNDPTLDGVGDAPPAHDSASNGDSEASEVYLSGSAGIAAGEIVADSRDGPFHPKDDAGPAETFGTAVAPPHRQVFGDVGGGERQSVGDVGNPERAAMSFEDLSQSDPLTGRGETSCTFPTDARGEVDGMKAKQECLQTTPNPIEEEEEEEEGGEEEEEAASVLYHEEPLRHSDPRCTNASGVPKALSEVHLHSVNGSEADWSNPQEPSESLRLGGEEAQEDDPTHRAQSQTTAETAEAQPTERTQIKETRRETLAPNEREEVMTGSGASFIPAQPQPEHDSEGTSSGGSTSCAPQTAQEEEINDYIHCEETIDSGRTRYRGIDTALWKHDDFYSADAAEVKNWETMVEEEEENMLRDEEESETRGSRADGVGALEEDQGEEFEETGIEASSETETEKEKQEEEMLGEITSVREKENMDEDEDALEGKQGSEEGSIGEIIVGIEGGEVEKELDVKTSAGEDEEKSAEEIGERKKGDQEETELEKGRHFAEMKGVSVERTNVQEEEEPEEEEEEEEEEEMMIDLNRDRGASVEGEDRVKPRDGNVEEEEMPVDQTSVTVDADSEDMAVTDGRNEAGCLDVVRDEGATGADGAVEEEQTARRPRGIHLYEEESDEGGASTESDSDDEVELRMRCLRAVGAAPRRPRPRGVRGDGGRGVGLPAGRSKAPGAPMPSISESPDEERPPGRPRDDHEAAAADGRSSAAAPPASSAGPESVDADGRAWWTETFARSGVPKTVFYATLLVLFVAVAHHYDFLACLGLYLMSVVWLCRRGGEELGEKRQRHGLN